MTFAERLAGVVAAAGPLCVGIDPSPAVLRAWGLADDPRGVRELGMRVVDACVGRVGVVKPQVAFFERHGARGIAALEEVLSAARASGLLAIADAKRGDILSTAEGYADAWLVPGAPLEADAVTASAYPGVGALGPLLDRAAEYGKGVFVLVVTSNPEATALQAAVRTDGSSVARGVLDDLRARAAPGSAGIVVGATARLADYGIARDDLDGLPVLAPGFGAQGARLTDLHTLYGGALALASVSRGVLGAGPDGIVDAIGTALGSLPRGAVPGAGVGSVRS